MAITDEMKLGCLAGNRLYLIILPTEACNFRCTYCYEEFQQGRMDAGVVQGLKKLLSHRADNVDDLVISWFGGEPLIAKGVVEEVMTHVQATFGDKPDMRIHSSMTTNGYFLTPQVFERLLELGVTEYQISFDGPRRWHDRRRVLAGGDGTFDRIWGNVTALKDVAGDFRVDSRLHVDRENLEDIPHFIESYGDAFAGDSRFQLFIRPLSALGGANDDKLKLLEGGMDGEEVCELQRYATSKGVEQRSGREENPVCYACMGNSFIVRADGRLNKCSVAMEHDFNQVGRLNEDGTLELNQPLMMQWMRGVFSGDEEVLKCPLVNFPVQEDHDSDQKPG